MVVVWCYFTWFMRIVNLCCRVACKFVLIARQREEETGLDAERIYKKWMVQMRGSRECGTMPLQQNLRRATGTILQAMI